MNRDEAQAVIDATTKTFKQWKFLGHYEINPIVEALSVLEGETEDAMNFHEQISALRTELTKTKRQLAASTAREAKLKKAASEKKGFWR